MRYLKEQYTEAAVAMLLGMDSSEPDPQKVVDAAHSFGFVFKSLQLLFESLKEAGLEINQITECMNDTLEEVMRSINVSTEYDYHLRLTPIDGYVREDANADNPLV